MLAKVKATSQLYERVQVKFLYFGVIESSSFFHFYRLTYVSLSFLDICTFDYITCSQINN